VSTNRTIHPGVADELMKASGKRRAEAPARRPKGRGSRRSKRRATVKSPSPVIPIPRTPPGSIEVRPRDIAALDDTQLRDVVSRLCKLQTWLQGGDASKVSFAYELKASDLGGDGTTPRNKGGSTWLPASPTCWQLKAGTAGEPAALKGEVMKPLPRKYLARRGYYVVVAGQYLGGLSGLEKRRTVLVSEARRVPLPVDKIEVRGAEAIADWCNEHPSISRWVLGTAPYAIVDEWAGQPEHSIPFQTVPTVDALIGQLQERLDPLSRQFHTHLWGHPGIGKSRLALEACRAAAWRDAVAYFPEPDSNARSFIDWVKASPTRRAVIIVDECDAEATRLLGDRAGLASGQIRLLTIGNERPEPRGGLRAFEVGPYPIAAINAILRGWFPHLPLPIIEFAARLSDGYVRFARVIGEAFDRDPGISLETLVGPKNLGRLLDRVLGDLKREHLHVFAILRSIGWRGATEDEGKAVAQCLGVSWTEAKATALRGQARGIIKAGGELCYLSPQPLALNLALDAWRLHSEALKGLPDLLPRESAIEAYYARLEEIGGGPEGAEFFRTELERFRTLSAYDPRSARFWTSVATFQPRLAAAVLIEALERTPLQERRAFAGEARRELVQSLPRLVWDAETFHDAMFALADLAAAENETWANNATGEFASHFQLQLGGTVVPYRERLTVLEALIKRSEPEYQTVVLKALAATFSTYQSRMGGAERQSARVVPDEWRPTSDQVRSSLLLAFDFLLRLIPKLHDQLQSALVGLVSGLIWPLSRYGYSDQLHALFQAAVARFPSIKDTLHQQVGAHLGRTRDAGDKQAVREVLRELYDSLAATTAEGRLHQTVGPDPQEGPRSARNLELLAEQFVRDSALVVNNLGWLTSGKANSAFEFGRHLGQTDSDGRLMEVLLDERRGSDTRLQVGYLLAQAQARGDSWLDSVIERLAKGAAVSRVLAFDVLVTVAPNDARVAYLMRCVESQEIPEQSFLRVAFSPWREALAGEQITRIVVRLRSGGDSGKRLATKLLAYWLKDRTEKLESVIDVALEIAVELGPLVGFTHEEWLWGHIARLVSARATREIVRSLCVLQATREGFFIEHHTPALEVLQQCVRDNPAETWDVVAEFLLGPKRGRFLIGFPQSFLQELPQNVVRDWIAEKPDLRARIIAHVVPADFSNDNTLAAHLLDQYGDIPGVEARLFGTLISGGWVGNVSGRWAALATKLDDVAGRTHLESVKRWARKAAESFRDMEQRARDEEADEEIRWR